MAEDTVSLLSITINFDLHVMQLFAPLYAGGKLVISKPGGHMDPLYMASLLERHGVTFFLTVPSLAFQYYSQPAAKNLTKLRSALHCGEPMPNELPQLIYQQVPEGVVVFNNYGTCLLIAFALKVWLL